MVMKRKRVEWLQRELYTDTHTHTHKLTPTLIRSLIHYIYMANKSRKLGQFPNTKRCTYFRLFQFSTVDLRSAASFYSICVFCFFSLSFYVMVFTVVYVCVCLCFVLFDPLFIQKFLNVRSRLFFVKSFAQLSLFFLRHYSEYVYFYIHFLGFLLMTYIHSLLAHFFGRSFVYMF